MRVVVVAVVAMVMSPLGADAQQPAQPTEAADDTTPPDGAEPDAPPDGEPELVPEPPLPSPPDTTADDDNAAPLDDTIPPSEDQLDAVEDSPGFTVAVHGFVSQGFIISSGNNYLARSRGHGSFELTEIGINFTSELTDELRIGVQLFARDLGPVGNYTPKFDWAYLDYRFADWLGIRAGRTKLPFGLYNDSSDIDTARTPILLPQSVYPIDNRDFLLAQTGVELYGRIDFGGTEGGGALSYRLYGGTIFLDLSGQTSGSPITVADLRVPYIAGGRILWDAPLEGLRIGGSMQALRLETDLLMGMMPVEANIDAVLGVASAEYVNGPVLLAIEYSRWHTWTESSDAMLFPATESTSERAYAMASYRFAPALEMSAYYSLYFPNVSDRNGVSANRHDIALSGRIDFNDHWLLKLEVHYEHGTAGLSTTLNDGTPPNMLVRDWVVVLAKTTAYF